MVLLRQTIMFFFKFGFSLRLFWTTLQVNLNNELRFQNLFVNNRLRNYFLKFNVFRRFNYESLTTIPDLQNQWPTYRPMFL